MKKYFVLPASYLLLLLASCRKEPNNIYPQEFNKVYGGSQVEGAQSIISTSGGGYLFAGWTLSNDGDVVGGHGQEDAWIVKLDGKGRIEWQRTFGGSSSDVANSVIKVSDGYVFTGITFSNDGDVSGNHGNDDFWVVKLDLAGNKVWQKTYGGKSNDDAVALVEAPDGGYVIVGNTKSNDGDVSGNHGNFDAWVLKIDRSGNKVWQKALGGSSFDTGHYISASTDGGYVVVGSTTSTNGDVTGPNKGSDDAWIIKLDGSGNTQWQKTLGGSKSDVFTSVVNSVDHGFLAAGITSSQDGDVTGKHPGTTAGGTNTTDAWLVKFTSAGTMVWQRTVGDAGISYQARSVASDLLGNFAIAGGITAGLKVENDDAMVAQLDSNGLILWQKTMGGSNGESFFDIIPVNGFGWAISGGTSSNDGNITGNHGSQDAWIVTLKTP